jgi:hypothetical protein
MRPRNMNQPTATKETPAVRKRAPKVPYSMALLRRWPEQSQQPWKNDWKSALWFLLKQVENDKTARGIDLMVSYYGLDTGFAKTLEETGGEEDPPLTRERVRQLIVGVLKEISKIERGVGYHGPQPFADVKAWFKRHQVKGDVPFVKLALLVKEPEVAGFKKNPRGLLAFLNDAGIRQVVYRGEHYLYSDRESRLDIIQKIQCHRKEVRKKTTAARVAAMSKTVTYVPQTVRDALEESQKQLNIPLNRMYENILLGFSILKPWAGHEFFFEKTKSWRSRKGKSEWVQVGLYISKDVYKDAQQQAKKADTSLMAYICRALAWGTSDDPTAKGVAAKTRKLPRPSVPKTKRQSTLEV